MRAADCSRCSRRNGDRAERQLFLERAKAQESKACYSESEVGVLGARSLPPHPLFLSRGPSAPTLGLGPNSVFHSRSSSLHLSF